MMFLFIVYLMNGWDIKLTDLVYKGVHPIKYIPLDISSGVLGVTLNKWCL